MDDLTNTTSLFKEEYKTWFSDLAPEEKQRMVDEALRRRDEQQDFMKELAQDNAKLKEEIDKLLFTPLHALYSEDIPQARWIVDSLIPKNGITVLSAPAGYYKTWLLLEMALKCAKFNATDDSSVAAKAATQSATQSAVEPVTEPATEVVLPSVVDSATDSVSDSKVFNHFQATSTGVLIVNEEVWKGILQDRLKLLIPKEDTIQLNGYNVHFLNQTGFKLREDHINHLIMRCKMLNIDLVMFDSLVRIHNQDENSSTEMKKVFEYLTAFTKEGISVLFTHHHRKSSQFKGLSQNNPGEVMRGSSDISAMVDSHIMVDKKNGNSDLLIISNPKQRLREVLKDFKVFIHKENDYVSFIYGGEYTETDEKQAKKKEWTEPIYEFIKANGVTSIVDVINMFQDKVGNRLARQIVMQLEEERRIVEETRKPKTFVVAEENFGGFQGELLGDITTQN